MIVLSPAIIIEFIVGIFLWWIAIFLISQNPFNKTIKLAFGFLTSVSFYFTTELLFSASVSKSNFVAYSLLFKIFGFCLFLPLAFLFHASSNAVQNKNDSFRYIKIYLIYIFSVALILLEIFSNTITDHSHILSNNFNGSYADAIGPYFWLMCVYMIITIVLIAQNFYISARQVKKYSLDWYKYIVPFISSCSAVFFGLFILLGYYGIVPYYPVLPFIDFGLLFSGLIYSIFRYNLFLDDAKVFFGKNFYFSTVVISGFLIIYYSIIFVSSYPFNSIMSLILPFAISYLVIASHPLYEWVSTFIRDLIYNVSSGYSIVKDEEIIRVIKHYNELEKLEDDPLLRLLLVSSTVKNGKANTPVDALRLILKDSLDYFRPDENEIKRIKKNLKYHLLRMLMIDQAEEGQILWELGFDDYPVRIMATEGRTRSPLFKIESPSDYCYTSRNAFIALKKEAIHSFAWRISYLEKNLSRKR